MDLRFLHFPTSLQVKRLAPQTKKNAHGPSLHIRFLSTCHFLYCIYNHLPTFGDKPTLLNQCRILIVLCISDSNMGDPKLLLFQNNCLSQNDNLCWWCVPRRDIFCLFLYVSWLNKCNMLSFRNPGFLKNVDILSDLASNILPDISCQIWHQISFRKDCYLNRKDY